MEIKLNLRKEDWMLFQAHVEKELPKQIKTWMDSFWASLVIWIVVVTISMTLFQYSGEAHWPTAIGTAIFFILIFVSVFANMFKMRKAFEPLEDGVFCGDHTFTFSGEGIASEGRGYKGHHSWEIVKQIERTPEMILIYLDKAYAYVFPVSRLDSPDEFFKYISEQWSNVTGNTSQSVLSAGD